MLSPENPNVDDCVDCLRQVHTRTPPPGRNSDITSSDEEEEVEADRDLMERMHAVEINLVELLDKSSNHKNRSGAPTMERKFFFERQQVPHSFPCEDTYKRLPEHPSRWPQRPVMLRPTPNTSTRIIGIRRVSSKEYQHFSGFCAGCILPVNTGSEPPGESLAIDFESSHFVGTLLMRIREAPPADTSLKPSPSCYFDGKKRKFQAIVQGRFKTPLKMSECVTGQVFDRPAGKLPARWIVTSFIKFVSTLAPELEATINADRPRFLTPLVSTAHTVLVNDTDATKELSLEKEVEEPLASSPLSVMQDAARDLDIPVVDHMSVAKRMKARKKAYNACFSKQSKAPVFDLDKVYTFEFYQHLLVFGEEGLAVDMGAVGKVGLASCTDGQPIKFMSAHKDPASGELDTLWSFDIWHESLYPHAQKAEATGENSDHRA